MSRLWRVVPVKGQKIAIKNGCYGYLSVLNKGGTAYRTPFASIWDEGRFFVHMGVQMKYVSKLMDVRRASKER